MNKQCFKVVFSRARGVPVAVPEFAPAREGGASSSAPGAGSTPPCPRAWPLSALALALALAMPATALAQIVADPKAPAGQRPTVLKDGQGRPLVNIQTPSAAGVSRNRYTQFDVNSNGAVLNNARQSNPWLAKGEAKVILNEVNSANPSRLRGDIRVNGSRADVVIANPAGIQVDGARFVNTSRATLTTGTPVVNGGRLDGFNVRGGTIDIRGKGLDARQTDYTDLLSRAVKVQADIKANDLAITTGTQQVDYDSGALTRLAGRGAKPTVAIDTGQLGGMYAGSIRLVATEAGVGVRNAGQLQAGRGHIVVTADGRIENSGTLNAAVTSVASTQGDIVNSGTLQGQQWLMASAGRDARLGGTLAPGGSGTGTLAVQAGRDIKLDGSARVTSTAKGGQVNLSAGRHIELAAGSQVAAHGQVQLGSDGRITADQASVRSTQGEVSALSAQGITLTDTTLRGKRVHLETGAPFTPTSAPVRISGGNLVGSEQATVLATGDLSVHSPGRTAVRGDRDLHLESAQTLRVTADTRLSAGRNATLVAGEALALQGQAGTGKKVTLNAGNNVALTGGRVQLAGSRVAAGGQLAVTATQGQAQLQAMARDGGTERVRLSAGKDLQLAAYQGGISARGLDATGQNLSLLGQGDTRIDGASRLQAGRHLALGSLGGTLAVHNATLNAGKELSAHAAERLTLANSALHAGQGLSLSSRGSLDSSKTTLAATDMLSLGSRLEQRHHQATLQGGALSLYTDRGDLSLAQSRLAAIGSTALRGHSGHLSVESGRRLQVDGKTRFQAERDLALISGSGSTKLIPDGAARSGDRLILSPGQLSAGRHLTLLARNGDLLVDGTGGDKGKNGVRRVQLTSKGDLTLAANRITARGSQLQAGGTLTLQSTKGDLRLEALRYTTKEGQFTNSYWQPVQLRGNKGIEIQAAGDLIGSGVTAYSPNTVNLLSGGDLTLSGVVNRRRESGHQRTGKSAGWNLDWHYLTPSRIKGDKGVTLAAAGGNLILNGSDVLAPKGSAELSSLGHIRLEAAQNHRLETKTTKKTKRKWYGKKTTTTTHHHREWLTARPVSLEAQHIQVQAGKNLSTFATLFKARGDLSLRAGDNIHYYAVQDRTNHKDTSRKTSSLFGVKYKTANSTNSRATLTGQVTKLQSQRDITSDSGGSQLLQGTRVSYGGRALFRAGVGDTARKDARILLEGVKNSVEESRTRESDYVVWQKQQGEGRYQETLTLPRFSGPALPEFRAPGGLTAQLPAGDFRREVQKLAGQPGMAYLGALTRRKDVDWRSVQLAHDQWQYKQQGLTPAGAALVAVAVAWATGPAGAGLLGTSTTPAGLMMDAALGSLATQASITLINNRGNIGNTLKELGSSQVVRATITAALTAGVLDKIGALNSMKALADSTAWQDQLTFNLVNASGQSLTNAAINGGKLGDALREALTTGLVNQVHGMTSSRIKGLEGQYVAHKLAHALAGCGAGAAVGGRCADGAIGAAVGEMVAELQDKPGAFASEKEWQAYRANTLALSKITAGAITAYAGGNAQTAINSADTAVKNNYLLLREAEEKAILERQLRGGQLSSDERLRIAARLDQLNGVDQARDQAIREACPSGSKGSAACGALVGTAQEALKKYGENVTYSLLYKDLYPRDARNLESILRGLDANSIVRDQAIAAIANASGISWSTAASRYDSAMTLHTVTATLAGYYGLQSITAPERTVVPRGVSRGAESALQGAQLGEYYRQLEKYGSAGAKELQNGRFRFYGDLKPARTSGEMAGARLVREWDPASGATRTWYETLDHAGNVRSVAPKPVTESLNHRIFDEAGNYIGRR